MKNACLLRIGPKTAKMSPKNGLFLFLYEKSMFAQIGPKTAKMSPKMAFLLFSQNLHIIFSWFSIGNSGVRRLP